MAAFGQLAFAQHSPSPSSHHALPTGPCNHRDVIGTCGCRQFWDKCSADIHESSRERRSGSERSTYCVCGHHACFHEASIAPAQPHAPPQTTRDELRNEASLANGSVVDEQGHDGSSLSSTTGLPRVPSVCLLSNDRYPAANRVARDNVNQSHQTIAGLGLSMLNVGSAPAFNDGQNSVASTIPNDLDFFGQPQKPGEPSVPFGRDNSVAGEQQKLTCSAPGTLDTVLEYNQQMFHLDIAGDTIPNTYNPEDFVQSATEVATPSNVNTPDLGVADQAVNEGKRFIEGLMRLTSNAEQGDSPKTRPATATSVQTPRRLLANSPHFSQEQLHNVLRSASPQALQKLVSYLTPLHNLLSSIPNVANTMREHGDRLSMLENNNSFNYAHPEEVQRTYDTLDGRLLHLENRMDDHDVLHQTIDADQSSPSVSHRRVATVTGSFGSNHSCQSTSSSTLILEAMDRSEVANEIGSIKDRLEVLEAAALPTSLNPWEVEIVLLPWGRDLRGVWFSPDESMHDPCNVTTQDTEEWTQARSSTLCQPRTTLRPFRDTDSSPFPGRSPRNSHPFSDTESGWSSQEISEWASVSADDLMLPKACGSNNLVYKRLKSRGLAVDVKFTSASATDIQGTISHAFKDLLERFRYTDEDESGITNTFPGLQASFIPLRKVIKSSRLRFLTPAEMVTSALWTAQFLASGVLMRVSGGKKRLYVTHREAYTQPSDELGDAWTWQQLRLLPRRQMDADSQMEGNDEHCQPQVPEADAREACWAFFEALDAPFTNVHSSFSSHPSLDLSMRPADRDWRGSMTPSSILKKPQPPQPISPMSEFHPQRPSHHRTVSASYIDPNTSTSSKRRLNDFPAKQSSAPQTHSHSRAPSNVTSSRLKRRRVTASSSASPPHPREEPSDHEAQTTIWANTPRRSRSREASREAQSPFFSTEQQFQFLPLPRSGSDLTSRPSQRSLAAAYATPHSGAFGEHEFSSHEFSGGGDTEPDDDVYQDDDGEPSWRGLTTPTTVEDGSGFSGSEGGGDGASLFGSSSDDGGSASDIQNAICGDDGDGDGEDEDEDGDDVYDTLLGVLRS
ncbi:hypothetical protein P280DRAFT_34377 [Massarina eburnea CBS 473.64]|uniref:Uncharacterized protein n=1 Tax=Massarina eburnea CBS 473.64 TaxID=1395130 RepID=A0A6A6RZ49_9PLEO|nr:hypothetical protein P280DRAFT_34377 [Massarina eburnea CBS 473.64]